MTSIAVISQKGGVGKTTVALNLAVAFAERGVRTLLVDLDPQGGVGHSLARGDGDVVGLADVWSDRTTLDAAILKTKLPGLSLLPRGKLDAVDFVAFEDAVRDRAPSTLRPLFPRFDYVIVDTPSGLSSVTRAALECVDFALVPVQAEPLALRSLGQALRLIDHVRTSSNPGLSLLGCVQTMVDRRTEASTAVSGELWIDFPGVLDTLIPRHEVFARASLDGVPVAMIGGPPSPESRRFDALAAELDAIVSARKGGDSVHEEHRSLL